MTTANTYHVIYLRNGRRLTGTVTARSRSHALSLGRHMLRAEAVISAVKL